MSKLYLLYYKIYTFHCTRLIKKSRWKYKKRASTKRGS
nr:MAG TPA: hypothetical protein [Caudoviricetes sp.]